MIASSYLSFCSFHGRHALLISEKSPLDGKDIPSSLWVGIKGIFIWGGFSLSFQCRWEAAWDRPAHWGMRLYGLQSVVLLWILWQPCEVTRVPGSSSDCVCEKMEARHRVLPTSQWHSGKSS